MTNVSLIRWLLAFVKPLRWLMAGAVTLGIISNIVVIIIPVLAAVTAFQIFSGMTVNLTAIMIVLICCGVIRGVARYCEQYLNHNIAFRLLAIIREKIFAQLRLLGPARLGGKKSGDLITAITTDVEALEVFFAHTVSPVLIACGTTILTVGFLARYHLGLALILLAGQLIVGVLLPFFSYRKHQQIGDNYQKDFVALNQAVMEDIASLQDIDQYNLQTEKLFELHQKGTNLNQQYRLRLQQGSVLRIAGEVTLIATSVIILVLAAFWQLPMETIIVAPILSLSGFGSVLALNGLGNDLLMTFASGRRIYALMQEIPAVTFGKTNETFALDKVSLQDVAFSYEQGKPILEKINFTLEAGEWLGIGGESGSGKSTLVKLLMRYWNPESGQININQNNLSELSEEALHQLEGLMEQQTFIFETTLLENIRLGNAAISHAAVLKAAEEAEIAEWINSLPNGLQTVVGGQARSLSDGERQRIGIARMLAYDAPLLLLDEPTSNLDYLNERSILSTLTKKIHGKTVLLISHRPTTLAITQKQLHVTGKTLKP
ncbi:amino acid ABC transporter ATP-binding/permease protein [Enterococcus sp. LJL90]